MELLTYDSRNLLKEGYQVLINRKKCIIYSIADIPFICTPNNHSLDEQLCYDLGYNIYEMLHGGGIIVVEPGDIDIAHFGDNGNKFRFELIEYLKDWLCSKGLNAEIDKNDILVDGYKICGTGIKQYQEIDYSTIHIGINTNLENIKLICKKPMKKIPKGLIEYGINSSEVIEKVLEFCNKIE